MLVKWTSIRRCFLCSSYLCNRKNLVIFYSPAGISGSSFSNTADPFHYNDNSAYTYNIYRERDREIDSWMPFTHTGTNEKHLVHKESIKSCCSNMIIFLQLLILGTSSSISRSLVNELFERNNPCLPLTGSWRVAGSLVIDFLSNVPARLLTLTSS